MLVKNNNQKEFIPQNELGVFYLFSRNREKLGFKEIVRINQGSSPDIIAIKDNGEQVGIELEHESRNVLSHYYALDKRDRSNTEERIFEWDAEAKKYIIGKWDKVGNVWNFIYKGEIIYKREEDYPNQYWYHKSLNTLLHSTVKSKGIDTIMYWIRNIEPDDFKFWEFDKDVEPIDLKERLSKIKDAILF